jgi:transposase
MGVLGRKLTLEELIQLERVIHSQKAQVRHVRRAGYVLAADRYRYTCEAVRAAHTNRHTLVRWCRRFLDEGIDGLLDKPRPGCPGSFTPEQRSLVIQSALTPPTALKLPFGEWTLQRLADYLHTRGVGMSASRVGELLREEGLRWHTQESWYGKGEVVAPDFVEKRGRLSGLTHRRRKAVSS